MDLGWLDPWFSSFTDVSHRDLTLPRKAWLHFYGLPLSLWNKSNWDTIIKEWGSFSHVEELDPQTDSLSHPLICIYIQQVQIIKETFKVLINNESFWVIIKETNFDPDILKSLQAANKLTPHS